MGVQSSDAPANHSRAAVSAVSVFARYTAMVARLRAHRPTMAAESLLASAAIYLTVAFNGPLWHGLLADRSPADVSTWGFAIAVGTACASVTFVMLALVTPRPLFKPMLTMLLIATAAAAHYMRAYGVVLDTAMLNNLLHTDFPEARELIGRDLLLAVLAYALVPIAAVWWPRLTRSPPGRAAVRRLLAICGAWVLAVAALLPVYGDLASLVRSKPELRHLLTPENYLVGMGQAYIQDTRRATQARVPVGEDARLAATWQTRTRPALLILVVGETVRADHFSLNGYERETTPELEHLAVVNYPDVRSCGTATEVSLPCMFSEVGRREYDGDRIRREEGLLHVLARAGLRVVWLDNQSGCKGVCAGSGIEFQSVRDQGVPGICTTEGCLDEILVHELGSTVAADARSQVIVMHMLGNHGPSYYSRYPRQYRRFLPTCDTAELRHCTREQIVNSYDNALSYTDHVIAQAITFLQSQSDRYDAMLMYVSDHGESLGEHGLYLHGMPYAIAPREQTHVPMLAWFSPEFERSSGIDVACVRGVAANPATHDNLFHSVLGLLEVQTSAYLAELDLFSQCRTQPAVAARRAATVGTVRPGSAVVGL